MITDESVDELAKLLPVVPLRTIIAWFGDWSDEKQRPIGFELCDGTFVETRGAIVQGKKPDLRRMFLMGLDATQIPSAPEQPPGNGEPTTPATKVETEGRSLELEHMPSHDHNFKDNRHSHGGSHVRLWTGPGGGASLQTTGYLDDNVPRPARGEQRGAPLHIVESGSNIDFSAQGGGKAHSHFVTIPPLPNIPPYVGVHYLIRVK